jgi:anti-sigma factor RsiW
VNHLDDETLSALVDDQLPFEERSAAEAHLGTCTACRQELDGFRSVATLLRALPEVEPPREFTLGPRLVADPPNLIRLRRWYTATRIAAGSLAAVFVFLSVGALYVDTRPAPTSSLADSARPQVVASSVAAGQSAPAPAAVRAAAPAAAPARAPQPDDQVAAATSVNPLPTVAPTPAPAVVVPAVAAPDSGAPWRASAAFAGVLAVVVLLSAVVLRHRLHTFRTENSP